MIVIQSPTTGIPLMRVGGLRQFYRIKILVSIAWSTLAFAQNSPADNAQTSALTVSQRKTAGARCQGRPAKHRPLTDGNEIWDTDVASYPVKELALGEELASQLEAEVEFVEDPVLTEYLAKLERKLLQNHDPSTTFAVKVIKDVEPNAFSLPGGRIYVNLGLLLAAENEAELAATLAHETAHIVAHHHARLVRQKRVWSRLLILSTGPLGILLDKKALPFLLLRTNRGYEFEADLWGLEYQYASGYAPEEFQELLKQIGSSDGNHAALWDRLSDSHPSTDARLVRLRKYIACYLPDQPLQTINTDEFDSVKKRAEELIHDKIQPAGSQSP